MPNFRTKSLILALSLSFMTAMPQEAFSQNAAPFKPELETLNLSPIELEALALVRAGKLDEAQTLLEGYFKKNKSTAKNSELVYFLSALQWKNEDYKAAESNLQEVLRSAKNEKQKVFVLKRIGNCHYQLRNFEEALKYYDLAIAECAKLEENAPVKMKLYEAKVGVEMILKQFDKAEADAKILVEIASNRAKQGNLSDKVSLLWAYLQLGTIYRTEKKESEHATMQQNLREVNQSLMDARARIAEHASEDTVTLKEVENIFLGEYVARNKPDTLAEYFWLASEFKPLTLPLIGWMVKEGEPKSILLCIHGLGLNNTSFAGFGKEMSKRGYSVYAMDVRGFGSWQSVPGEEDVGFKAAVTDIGAVIDHLKVKHPNSPVFLLGESMGGGIALRTAAEIGDNMQGVIASVPSAERFQARRFGLTVAAHFLDGPNRPFNIGGTVSERATTNEEILKEWSSNSKAKMKMSPKELIKFAVFMRTTLHHCKKIDKTPALIVQGLKDRLVKPEGTMQMFDAISGEDKTMLIDGTAEHLIFESNVHSPVLLDTLCSWLDKHAERSN